MIYCQGLFTEHNALLTSILTIAINATNLQSNIAIDVCVHQRKNFSEKLMYVGRIPTEHERNHKDPIKTLNGIKNKIPKYSTCVTHKEFYD